MLAYGRWEVSIKAGLGLTPTPIERASAKQREHEALLARYALGDTLQKLLDELQRNRRDVGNELANQRMSVHYSNTAFAANRHVLDYPELADARDVAQDAYTQTITLDQETHARWDKATENEGNDPAWLSLTDEETRKRSMALDAAEEACSAIIAVLQRLERHT